MIINNHHKPMGLIMVYLSVDPVADRPRGSSRSSESLEILWWRLQNRRGLGNAQNSDRKNKTWKKPSWLYSHLILIWDAETELSSELIWFQKRYVNHCRSLATLWLHRSEWHAKDPPATALDETFASQVSLPGAQPSALKPTAGLSRQKRNWRVREWCE